MRSGAVAGTSLILLEGAAWMTERFSGVWWAIELLQVGVVSCAIFLITRRMAKLEVELKSQRKRLAEIATFLRDGLRLKPKEEGDTRRKPVLRSVS